MSYIISLLFISAAVFAAGKKFACHYDFILTLCAVSAVFLGIYMSYADERRAQYEYCLNNMRDITSAAEIYCCDDIGGNYPQDLDSLMPYYFWELPVCPQGGKYQYRASSDFDEDLKLEIRCRVHSKE